MLPLALLFLLKTTQITNQTSSTTTKTTKPKHNTKKAANLEAFDSDRAISLVPPDGEFALVNYRTSHGVRAPFRLQLLVEPDGSSELKALVSLRLWADMPADKAASGLEVELPLPRCVQRVHCSADPRYAQLVAGEYNEKTHVLRWRFKKLPGGSDVALSARLTLERPYGPGLRSEVGCFVLFCFGFGLLMLFVGCVCLLRLFAVLSLLRCCCCCCCCCSTACTTLARVPSSPKHTHHPPTQQTNKQPQITKRSARPTSSSRSRCTARRAWGSSTCRS